MLDQLTISTDSIDGPIEEGDMALLVAVSVNGQALAEWLDVDEFFQSLLLLDTPFSKRTKTRKNPKVTSKRIPLFNCSCGGFGCGGYYVEVSGTSEALFWETYEDMSRPWPHKRYSFSWDNVRNVAGELIAAIRNTLLQNPNEEVRYGGTCEDLGARLSFYQERFEVLTALAGTTRGDYGTYH